MRTRDRTVSELVVSLPTLRQWIAAGWLPIDPRYLLALIEAIEADHEWHLWGTTAAWHRRERAFMHFEYAEPDDGFDTSGRHRA